LKADSIPDAGVTKRVILVWRFPANPETDQNHGIGKKIGNGMDRIHDEGLTMAYDACYQFE
jgi:hypothetical protein